MPGLAQPRGPGRRGLTAALKRLIPSSPRDDGPAIHLHAHLEEQMKRAIKSPPPLRGRVRVGGASEESMQRIEPGNPPPPRPAPVEGAGAEGAVVAAGEAEIRLDRWFKRHFPNLTHGRLEKLLRTGQIRVD